MDAHEDTPRIQVLSVSDTGRRRRRRWTDGYGFPAYAASI